VRFLRAPSITLVLLVAVAACDQSDVLFTTKVPSDLARTTHAASVLGVYRDGRMSMAGWDVLAPYVEPALGSAHCEVGYDTLVGSNAALASAVDDYARANGPTDELLAQLAPAAQGDLILVLTFAGKLPEPVLDAEAVGASPAPAAGGGSGRGRSAGLGGPHAAQSDSPRDANQLEISASLFSVSLGRSVALVGLQYLGKEKDDAMAKFAAKLKQSLPNMRCVGWSWKASIDPERVRSKINE
jgi:hypothetical protein